MAGTQQKQGNDLKNLVEGLHNIDLDLLEGDPGLKDEALTLARKITAILEGPVNRATDLVFKPYVSIAARIAVDLDLFKHIVQYPHGVTSQTLASLTGGDEVLISRVLRLLASTDIVDEPAHSQWTANDVTHAMATPTIAAGHRFVFDVLVSSAIKAPKYLRETKYQAPTEPTDGFIQYANQTKLNVFEYLQSMPSLFADFNLFMGNTMGAREYWHDWYDVQGRLLNGFEASESSTLLVDIGGGKGHDMTAFDSAFGEQLKGKQDVLVLQDLPQVLDAVPEDELRPTITKMAHDFFVTQPVKGARGYFLHHILHDWSDKYCLMILESLRKAMKPGYSKLLIHDLILPDTGSAEIQARFDLVMMTFNGGMERDRTQWTGLLENAGFCNIKLWEHFDHDGIIEAEVPIN